MAKVLFMRSPRNGIARDQCRKWSARIDLWMILAAVAIATLLIVIATEAHAQTFSVIYTFAGLGANPEAGLTMDRAGNFYGTTLDGGYWTSGQAICQLYRAKGCGTVFKLSKHGSDWLLSELYKFHGADGAYPATALTIGPNGSIYGATSLGGNNCSAGGYGCGTVFNLTPGATAPSSVLAFWSESLLYAFLGTDDGGPYPSQPIFDNAGNLYGTTAGGTYGAGNVFELAPSGNGWTESVLYSFYGGSDGLYPSGLVLDNAGNFFGTTFKGGNDGCDSSGCGTVFELTRSGSGWTKTILHLFQDGSDGAWPLAAPIMDQAGNLYGTSGGAYVSPGTVWEMSPSDGGWTFTVLYTFSGFAGNGPYSSLAMDADGSLYGVTYAEGANDYGNVFKLSPSNGSWTYTDLYDFTGGNDGCYPRGSLTLDASGNVSGTASKCGANSVGTVFEITP